MMTVGHFITLGFLILLQVVLGFDNLLYISLESRRAPAQDQHRVRRIGIALAIVLRIALLFLLVQLIEYVEDPLFSFDNVVVAGVFDLHSLVVLGGGVFIMYTAVKEIWHMVGLEQHDGHEGQREPHSAGASIALIAGMNVVFSFDSILSALALTDVFWVMATAIVVGGLLMIVLADAVSAFLEKNRMYEVLGLFILLIVGVMLLSDGGHLAQLRLFGHEVNAMSKTTFYFVITVLVLTDVVQSRYKKKLSADSQPPDAGTGAAL